MFYTPPNFTVYAERKHPVKCFKICHILYIIVCSLKRIFIRELKYFDGTFCRAQITKLGGVVERRRRHDDHHIEP